MQNKLPGNTLFFYGFPRDNVTSNQIRSKIKEISGVDIGHNQPQIRRDITKPDWNAVVKFDSQEDAQKVQSSMRFFQWYPDEKGKVFEIRVLPHDPEVKQRDTEEVKAKNVFCR